MTHQQLLRFWASFWQAADTSRAYRRHAADWRAAGFDDYAAALDHEADLHDVAWSNRLMGIWADR